MSNITTPKEFFFLLGIENTVLSDIEKYLTSQYNTNTFDEILNITPGELLYIKEKLTQSENKYDVLKQFIDKEITQTNLEEKLKLINEEITEIDSEIEKNNNFQKLYSIIVGEYNNIQHWDDIFNIGDINDIKTELVTHNTSHDFSSIISDTIGFNDYNNLSGEDKNILNILFTNIKSFHEKNAISGYGEIKDFLKTYKHEFIKYIQTELKEIRI